MNAWSHLPNAKHIDRILASAKANPELWLHTSQQARYQVWIDIWNQSLEYAEEQARYQVWQQARYQAYAQPYDQARKQAWYQARDQVTGALLALIAYDDCASYLDLSVDQLQMLYALTDHPACFLLQPSAVVFAKEKELT
jgi:hypothetical protein